MPIPHIFISGVVVPRWVPWSSKPVAGRAERAAVGSTPILSRHRNNADASTFMFLNPLFSISGFLVRNWLAQVLLALLRQQ